MKKRIVSMLLLAVLLCSLLAQTVPSARALPGGDPTPVSYQIAGSCGENLNWRFEEGGELRISGSGAMNDFSDPFSAPWHHLAAMVTKITLPAGLTRIGSFAFSFSENVVSVTVPEGVTSIGNGAFLGCENLKSVKLPDSLTTLEAECFYQAGLLSVVIPKNVTNVGANAFTNCYLMRYAAFRNPKCRLISQTATFTDEGVWDTKAVNIFHSHCMILVDHDESLAGLPPMIEEPAPRIREYYSYIESYAKDLEMRYAPLHPFSDVTEGKYYEIPVAYAAAFGVASGTGGGKFSPSKTCTREQVVTFLHAAFGKQPPQITDCPFTDIMPGKYYYNAVLWAYENGITSGTSPTKFGVGKPCTRAQIMTFLWKSMGSPEATITSVPFTDVNPEKYYFPAVLWAYENGITGGVSATKFGTGKTCTRAQMVTFLSAAAMWKWSHQS